MSAWRALVAAGVPWQFVSALYVSGNLGRALVTESNGRWTPAQRGEGAPRLILGVRERGVLVDLVALSSGNVDHWSLRLGGAAILGLDHFWAAQLHGRALRLFGAPMDWLRNGGAGICVLDWTAEAYAMLRGLGSEVTLIADNADAAEALREELKFGGLPKVAAGDVGRLAA